MIRERELDLLIDLLKLRRKYGAKSFELLAKALSSPEMTKQLSEILANIPSKAKTLYVKKKSQRANKYKVPKALVTLERVDPQKYELLLKFFNDLVAKTVLPSLGDIKYFAEELGLPEVRAKSRQKAISPFISSLALLPFDKIKSRFQSSGVYRTGDRSLEGWSKIILDKKEE